MRAVVVYESMVGNTRQIADAIGTGLVDGCVVSVIPVAQAGPDQITTADLVVVGGPTHVHGMTRASTRQGAAKMARKRTVASFWNRTQWPKVCANGWTRLARARSVAGQPPSTRGCPDRPLLPAVLPRELAARSGITGTRLSPTRRA